MHPPIEEEAAGAMFEEEHTDDEYQEFLTDQQVEQAAKRNYFRSIAAIKDGFTGYASEIDFSKPTITDAATLTELF